MGEATFSRQTEPCGFSPERGQSVVAARRASVSRGLHICASFLETQRMAWVWLSVASSSASQALSWDKEEQAGNTGSTGWCLPGWAGW